MPFIRCRLACAIAVWLTVHVAGLTAAVSFVGPDDCCQGLAPGQTCPMHHPVDNDRTCKMRSAFHGADFILVSLAGGLAIVAKATTVVMPFDVGATLPSAAPIRTVASCSGAR
jgi:hypothetical protein